jgi:glucose-1-phosphate thymidylyltransferase
VSLVIEPAMEEGQKLGSVGALKFFADAARGREGGGEDMMVINGDNVFEFDLSAFADFYEEKGGVTFGIYDTGSIDEARKMGVVLAGDDGVVQDFEEKPEHPKTTTVSTGIYIFPSSSIGMISQYIEEGNSPDRMGDFLAWLLSRQKLYAFVFRERWFDIGTPETYMQADREMSGQDTEMTGGGAGSGGKDG